MLLLLVVGDADGDHDSYVRKKLRMFEVFKMKIRWWGMVNGKSLVYNITVYI